MPYFCFDIDCFGLGYSPERTLDGSYCDLVWDVILVVYNKCPRWEWFGLDAIARAYNYASDPTIPDLAREDTGTWIEPTEQIRLEQACSLLQEGYESLYRRVGDDLEQYKQQD